MDDRTTEKEIPMITLRHLIPCAVLLMAGAVHAGEPVDINTANAESLAEAIDGVGIKKARDIVTYRQKNGPFESVDELIEVSGIGRQTVDGSRENLTVKNGD
jgi:competence protein ComEA